MIRIIGFLIPAAVFAISALTTFSQEQPPVAPKTLLDEFRAGPMKDVKQVLFVARKPGKDEHWYANFGYYAADDQKHPFPLGSGASLNLLDLDTREIKTILKDDTGSIRDPQIHYDAGKILFSYLPGGKEHYNLYEINIDGSGLKQLTSGDWDDIEPSYLANGDIVFCSSRAKRWVQCWLTGVATIHRCGPNGENIRELSCNTEQDNTPWPLPNGQILYMRWEYVDRSQVHYHHLWTMNPDGTRQMVYYGNLAPGIVMLGAKPIPDSRKIVSVFSPGHGVTEHYGRITIVDPSAGPDRPESAQDITGEYDHADPWAFSETSFMASRYVSLDLITPGKPPQEIFTLPEEMRAKGYWLHEPRPLIKRERETIISDQTDLKEKTGTLALLNVYEGRQMADIKPGSIKELLILESLPEPIHYSGGMDQISAGGTFTLERIFGTVPLDADGSAYIELPALRSFFFVAMDQEGKPVKRMHSFTSVMPGETTSCIGCHEQRTQTPRTDADSRLLKATHKAPLKPVPVPDIPDVFDFARDIQPILDKHCVECHNDERTDAGVDLSGDWTPLYTRSYLTLSGRNMLGDNRNRPESNFKPYEIGSSASRLMKLLEAGHADVKLSDLEKKFIKYWLEVGGNYAGTYAANGTGLIGWPYHGAITHDDLAWPETTAMKEAIEKRCDRCHSNEKNTRLAHYMSEEGTRYDRNYVYNLSFPEKSKVLRAALAKDAGGTARCSEIVFSSREDPDYRTILAGVQRGRDYILKESNRFSMKPFIANWPYTREMIRYGVLPKDHDPKKPIDPYETDRKYWESLWHTGEH